MLWNREQHKVTSHQTVTSHTVGPKGSPLRPCSLRGASYQGGVTALQEADGTRCRDPRGPAQCVLPPQGQTGPKAPGEHRPGLGSGCRVQEAGRGGGPGSGGSSAWCLLPPVFSSCGQGSSPWTGGSCARRGGFALLY